MDLILWSNAYNQILPQTKTIAIFLQYRHFPPQIFLPVLLLILSLQQLMNLTLSDPTTLFIHAEREDSREPIYHAIRSKL